MPKLKTQFSERFVKKGTVINEPSKTDLTQQQDSDIYAMFEKYGVNGVVPQQKAGTLMFVDTINDPLMQKMTLQETLLMENEIEEYYASLPAKVRKVFGDNKREFLHKYKNKEFDEFLQYGILSKEQINILTQDTSTNNKEVVNEQKEIISESNS